MAENITECSIPAYMYQHMQEYVDLSDAALPWHDKSLAMAKQFAQFSLAGVGFFTKDMLSTDPNLGTFGCHSKVAGAFLSFLRYKDSSVHSKAARKVSTLSNLWLQTRTGMKLLLAAETAKPGFLLHPPKQDVILKRILEKWEREDLKDAPIKAYLMEHHIQDFSLQACWYHMQAQENTPDVYLFLLHALFLRLQSGTNCRHVDLVDLQWKDVEQHDYVVALDSPMYSFWVAPAKIIARGGTKVEYCVHDAITYQLFHWWYQYFSPKSSLTNAANVFVFPAVNNGRDFNFQCKFSYTNHKEACQLCTSTLGLSVSNGFFNALGANSVRRGNAAKLGEAIKGIA